MLTTLKTTPKNMKTLALFGALGAFLFAPASGAQVLISEVLYDGTGADASSAFIELAGPAGTDLTGYSLVGVNGNGGSDYSVLDLSGAILPTDGVLVIATSGADAALAAEADLVDDDADLQNGPDSVQLLDDTGAVIDALGYGDFSASVFAGEGAPAADAAEGESLARDADLTDTDDNAADFSAGAPTPGVAGSVAPPPPPAGSCAGQCGGSSADGSCWCDESCFQYGDCCDDVCTECAVEYETQCTEPDPDCVEDADCASGEQCVGGICIAPPQPGDTYGVAVDSVDATNFPSVSFTISVTDETGSTVGTLAPEDFLLIEDGVPMEDCTVNLISEGTGAPKADIVFVFDSTGSMSDEIEDLRQNILDFTTTLEGSNIDYNLGLVVFGDDVEGIYGMTQDANEFRSFVQSVALGQGVDENPLAGLVAGTQLDLRPDSERMFVLATDETYTVHNTTLADALSALTAAEVKVHAATLPELNASFDPLVGGTGGSFFDITASFGAVLDDLSEGILNRYAVVCDSPNPVRDNTTRVVDVQVDDGAASGAGTGSYFVEGGALIVDPTFSLVDIGSTLSVDIVASGVTDLQNAHVVLDFDPGYLSFADAEAGELLARDDANGPVDPPFTLFDPAHDPANGRIAVAVARQSEDGTDGTGVLVTLTFDVTGPAPEDADASETDDLVFGLGAGEVFLEDSQNNEIVVVDVQDGDVDTNGCGLLGDFDQDCDIDLVDFNTLVGEFGSSSPTVTDIGPAEDLPPAMTPDPDGIVDHHDLFVFTRMYNWFRFGQ